MDLSFAIDFAVVMFCIWGTGLVTMACLAQATEADKKWERAKTWESWTQPEVWDGIEIEEEG